MRTRARKVDSESALNHVGRMYAVSLSMPDDASLLHFLAIRVAAELFSPGIGRFRGDLTEFRTTVRECLPTMDGALTIADDPRCLELTRASAAIVAAVHSGDSRVLLSRSRLLTSAVAKHPHVAGATMAVLEQYPLLERDAAAGLLTAILTAMPREQNEMWAAIAHRWSQRGRAPVTQSNVLARWHRDPAREPVAAERP